VILGFWASDGDVMTISSEDRKYFEEMGEAEVRLQYGAPGFGGTRQISARKWLGELDEAHGKRAEALQAEQTRLGKSTLVAAWIAAGAAIIAVVVGILTWIFPLH
jgi:hypothetical protein